MADRRRESPLDERLKEVRALLAVDDAGEAAVLALDEDARVQEHVQQEPRLTLGEAERRDGFHPLGIGQVDCPAVGFRRQHHRINSSDDSRVCGPPSAAAAPADRASDREIAGESGLGGAAGMGAAIVAGDDLKILMPRAAVSVLGTQSAHPGTGRAHRRTAARVPAPSVQSLRAHGPAGRRSPSCLDCARAGSADSRA